MEVYHHESIQPLLHQTIHHFAALLSFDLLVAYDLEKGMFQAQAPGQPKVFENLNL